MGDRYALLVGDPHYLRNVTQKMCELQNYKKENIVLLNGFLCTHTTILNHLQWFSTRCRSNDTFFFCLENHYLITTEDVNTAFMDKKINEWLLEYYSQQGHYNTINILKMVHSQTSRVKVSSTIKFSWFDNVSFTL